jgi:hypothetical protein
MIEDAKPGVKSKARTRFIEKTGAQGKLSHSIVGV